MQLHAWRTCLYGADVNLYTGFSAKRLDYRYLGSRATLHRSGMAGTMQTIITLPTCRWPEHTESVLCVHLLCLGMQGGTTGTGSRRAARRARFTTCGLGVRCVRNSLAPHLDRVNSSLTVAVGSPLCCSHTAPPWPWIVNGVPVNRRRTLQEV